MQQNEIDAFARRYTVRVEGEVHSWPLCHAAVLTR